MDVWPTGAQDTSGGPRQASVGRRRGTSGAAARTGWPSRPRTA